MATEKENYAHNEIGTGQSHANMSVGRYIATRIPTLKPPMAKVPNPIRLLRLLNFQQWMFFLVAFLAWAWDAFDFFTVSLTVEDEGQTQAQGSQTQGSQSQSGGQSQSQGGQSQVQGGQSQTKQGQSQS